MLVVHGYKPARQYRWGGVVDMWNLPFEVLHILSLFGSHLVILLYGSCFYRTIGLAYISTVIDTPVSVAGKVTAQTSDAIRQDQCRCRGIAKMSEIQFYFSGEII
ncbi:hypothetical protein D9M68_604610 [compost metagenome]